MPPLHKIRLSPALVALVLPHVAWAQTTSAGNAGGAAFVSFLVYLPVAMAVINIALMLWLWPDARARGIQKPYGWLVALFFFGPLALVFYLGARPPGSLKQCDRCGEECLQSAVQCPHCAFRAGDPLPEQEHRHGPAFSRVSLSTARRVR